MIPVFPDSEAVAAAVLRSDTALASLVGGRIYTAIPAKNPVFPLITLQRIGGGAPVRQYLDGPSLQVEVWSNSSLKKAEVSEIARTARAAFHNAEQSFVTLSDSSRAWITGVGDSLGLFWQPDAVTNNARYIFGVRLYLHAA